LLIFINTEVEGLKQKQVEVSIVLSLSLSLERERERVRVLRRTYLTKVYVPLLSKLRIHVCIYHSVLPQLRNNKTAPGFKRTFFGFERDFSIIKALHVLQFLRST